MRDLAEVFFWECCRRERKTGACLAWMADIKYDYQRLQNGY